MNPSLVTYPASNAMTDAHKRMIVQLRWRALAGTLALALNALALVGLLILKARLPAFASRGELFVVIPILLFWLWLLRRFPSHLLNINRDLQAGQLAYIEGRAAPRWRNTIGMVQLPKYEVLIGTEIFALTRDQFFEFINQHSYRVTYSPRAKAFLGATELLTTPAPDIQPPASEVSTLLNPQEVKLLKLAADGLSNKEIATALSLSVNTVKMYSSQIYRKLGVSRRTEAIAAARKQGIL